MMPNPEISQITLIFNQPEDCDVLTKQRSEGNEEKETKDANH